MSIASEITSIGENLKKDYQSIANLGADLTNVDKNIENIAELLDGVYDNLPKTEYQEGTEITLENCLKGKLDFDNGVVGIGQNSQDSTEGYNLYKPSTVGMPTYYCTFQLVGDEIVLVSQHDGEIYYGGVSNAGSGYVTQLGPKIPVKPSTTYRISSSSQELSRFFVTKFNSSNISLGFVQANPTFTTDANTSYVTLRAGVYSSTNNTTYRAKIWLYEGSAEKSYEPYTNGASPNPSYEQEIKSVTGNQDVVVKDGNNNTIAIYQLSLGEHEFNAIGNYKDELIYDVDEDRVYKNEKIEKVDITSARVFEFAQSSYGNYVQISVVKDFIKTSNIINVMSNIANATAYDDRLSNTDTYRILTYDTNVLQLRVPVNSGLDTMEQIKTLIDNSNMYALIKLATPTLTEITDATLKAQVKAWYNAHSLNGTTIITSNGNLPMIIKCRGLKGE